MISNRDSNENIIKVLEKIKGLGIRIITFNEDFYFTDIVYYLTNKENEIISYVDNLEIIPNYDEGIVKYKTSDSNYQIDLGTKRIGSKIYLNSLVFDMDRLPNTIIKDDIIYKIINLKKEQQEEIDVVKKSVNLNVCIDDYYHQLKNVELQLII